MSDETITGQIPCLDGWFTWPPSSEPFLLGSRCKKCGDYFFPQISACGNPACMNAELEQVNLSRKGKLYSFTINYKPAPPPYVPPDPFLPYAIGVMELAKEKMMIQGQIVTDYNYNKLKIGMDIEVVLDPIYKDNDGKEVIAWKFKPI